MTDKKATAPQSTVDKNPTHAVANEILADLTRVHVRVPRF